MGRPLFALLALGSFLTLGLRQATAAAIDPRIDLGPRQAAAATRVVLVLAHRNQRELDALLSAIAQGRAKPISRTQFARTYAAGAASLRRVETFLKAKGFRIERSSDSLILASAPSRTVENTFNTKLHNLREATRGDWYAPASRPLAPAAIAPLLATVMVSSHPMYRAGVR
jgi:subtilase family serine protease